MRIIPGNAQHIGQRSSQQDAFAFSDIDDQALTSRTGVVAVLADGMGGLAFGKEASQLAVNTFSRCYLANIESGLNLPKALDLALAMADEAVVRLGERMGEAGNVGTTLVAFVVHDADLYWRSVGDSRLYLWRKPFMIQLTEDHDYGRELNQKAREGQISLEQARNHPNRAALTSFIGQGPATLVDGNQRPFRLQSGDRLLACSDGLYKSLSEPDITRLLRQCETPHDVAENAVHQVLAQQVSSQDNITVLVVECDDQRPTVKQPTTDANRPGLFRRASRVLSLFRIKKRGTRS